jgi:hypothetical protein
VAIDGDAMKASVVAAVVLEIYPSTMQRYCCSLKEGAAQSVMSN